MPPKNGSSILVEAQMSNELIKIKSLDELAGITADHRSKGEKVALCHGVFDLLHPGHIRHFEAAHREADVVIVVLVADEYVLAGPGYPVFSQRLRAESIAALEAVDYVAIAESTSAIEAIQVIRPDMYIVGRKDYGTEFEADPHLQEEVEAIKAVGGELFITDEITFSSTRLLNDHLSVYTPQAEEYLKRFKERYRAAGVIDKLKALAPLKVLVIGDIIIDEYYYCKAMGKSSKSPTLTARYLSAERHAGGALAVANHVAGLVNQVSLLALRGNPSDEAEFIRTHLLPNVQTHLVEDMERPLVVKRRYVDPFQNVKMFEICWLDGEGPSSPAEDQLLEKLKKLLGEHDMVIVADFGHSGIGSRTIEWLTQQQTYLAINAQTNSANMGYNLITKYPRADYICLDEEEMRLANQSLYGTLTNIAVNTAEVMHCEVASVTLGSRGSMTFRQGEEPVFTPIFSTDVVDSVGAGDAFLSITSLCAKAGYPADLIGFIGNCVGAIAVRIVGNREPVGSNQLFSFINALLK